MSRQVSFTCKLDATEALKDESNQTIFMAFSNDFKVDWIERQGITYPTPSYIPQPLP
ncbi:hypothetical protein QJS10_CPA09g00416 [Acorus calamus]|uniref:Uncharacterized protein n=1 Tax=Acorus calamus TaxID=4465 RepID=A0AAV9E653_ACOCL|nr:hypothetical protein QJS10_CPA09g00416 [Acorus calamus]